ncbi:MAG: glycosyl hydrolase [Paludibacter sp.]|nr:glycosyl hydrolase [Paludibacter sp.]
MKTKLLLLFFIQCALFIHAEEIFTEKYVDQNVTVPAATDLHITGTDDVLLRSYITLAAEDSWLFFDNIKPLVVVNNYSKNILIAGDTLKPGENGQVRVYAHGTVVIPQSDDFQPLEVFTNRGLRGDSHKYSLFEFYKDLGEFDNAIRSFRLKRGYMATFANNSDGTGYSRVFIADKEDLEVQYLPDVLDQTISFIRVFKWDWNTKKGWCGGDPGLVDTLNCTWYYSWSADKNSTYNYQYVPIKQSTGWPGFDEIYNKTNVSHLLGYNEPDRSDQSDVTVEEAIAQWPELMKSGLRLGSPVPSNPGNGNGWLYDFLDKCDSLNYRVDYVVVHAYWGGLSPESWYSKLKGEYNKCGKRPIWITEWNNGANWTNEYWPDDVEGQEAKQLSDLKKILNVLDTCSFIERYSIYDWVNEVRINSNNDTKTVVRAMIWNGEVTPAGEYYRDNKSAIAFNPDTEVIPTWNFLTPTLDYTLDNDTVKLEWTDPNEGLVSKYIVEKKNNADQFDTIAELSTDQKTYTEVIDKSISGNFDYKITLSLKSGSENVESNAVKYGITSGNSDFQYGQTALNTTDWSYFKFKTDYSSVPVVVFGAPSYTVSSPLSSRVKGIDNTSFQFHLDTWQYLDQSTFADDIDISYLIMPQGDYDLNGIKAEAGAVKSVGRTWRQVTFEKPFDVTPAVFVSQITSRNGYATAVRLRNVTSAGFEIALQKESALTNESATITLENVNYIALTPGSGTINGKKIAVGLTGESVVGTIYSPAKITFGDTFENPALFANMQTTSDDVVSTLRFKNLTDADAVLFRQPELSKGGSPNAGSKETAGWMVIDLSGDISGTKTTLSDENIGIYPNPARDILHIKRTGNQGLVNVEIFSVSGQKIMEEKNSGFVDIQALNSGFYIVRVNHDNVFKFLKE